MKNESNAELLREILQRKWRLQVLHLLTYAPQRLSQLRRSIPEASKKMIIDTLHGLENLGWVMRTDLSERTRHVEYSLVEGWEEKIKRLVVHLGSERESPGIGSVRDDVPI